MVRPHHAHLKLSTIQQHHHPTAHNASAASAFSSLSPLSAIGIPAHNLLHPLISETSYNATAVSDRIPGFKTSAAFLTSLRANLQLSSRLLDSAADPRFSSNLPSLCNTPDFGPTTSMSESTGILPEPPVFEETSLATTSEVKDPLADVPPLITYEAEDEDDRIEGLHLVADSVALQRQVHSRQLIFHPLSFGLWIAVLAVCAQYLYHGSLGDLLLVGTTWAGISMAGLLAIRFITQPYLEFAEQVGTWKWLGKDSDIIVTKYGDRIIGALIIQITKSSDNITDPESPSSSSSPSSSPKKSSRSSRRSNVPLRGLIRGWTVINRYRHRGIGTGLLEEAVRYCKSRGINPQIDGNIEFADDHANHRRAILENGYISYFRFNDAMNRKESQGRELLDQVIRESIGEKGKRNKGGRGRK